MELKSREGLEEEIKWPSWLPNRWLKFWWKTNISISRASKLFKRARPTIKKWLTELGLRGRQEIPYQWLMKNRTRDNKWYLTKYRGTNSRQQTIDWHDHGWRDVHFHGWLWQSMQYILLLFWAVTCGGACHVQEKENSLQNCLDEWLQMIQDIWPTLDDKKLVRKLVVSVSTDQGMHRSRWWLY